MQVSLSMNEIVLWHQAFEKLELLGVDVPSVITCLVEGNVIPLHQGEQLEETWTTV